MAFDHQLRFLFITDPIALSMNRYGYRESDPVVKGLLDRYRNDADQWDDSSHAITAWSSLFHFSAQTSSASLNIGRSGGHWEGEGVDRKGGSSFPIG
ncbi:hypothetical protein Y032_0032g2622 [Ancylostoma ceylanicum]|uniref:Uncharacterized protein n=1 Tax=Ancylostoma ceylanicum TaxID=53326 RepID=A0A016UNP8_9BILA|nr:hypothetical protein Y032_0032g2622 [Ancylostoma ceylanicum]